MGWKDPLEEGMAAHSRIVAWRIPMERGAWWAIVYGVSESDTTEQLSMAHNIPLYHIFIHSSDNGHIGCFHEVAIAAMNIGEHVSFQIIVFS